MTAITAIRGAGTATVRGLVLALCAALALAGCSSGSAASGTSTASMTAAAITSAPVRTVRTADGTVGYRWFGTCEVPEVSLACELRRWAGASRRAG